jgi:hypothetical protein
LGTEISLAKSVSDASFEVVKAVAVLIDQIELAEVNGKAAEVLHDGLATSAGSNAALLLSSQVDEIYAFGGDEQEEQEQEETQPTVIQLVEVNGELYDLDCPECVAEVNQLQEEEEAATQALFRIVEAATEGFVEGFLKGKTLTEGIEEIRKFAGAIEKLAEDHKEDAGSASIGAAAQGISMGMDFIDLLLGRAPAAPAAPAPVTSGYVQVQQAA